jgi:uncharacterized damage-inducible protein DinB
MENEITRIASLLKDTASGNNWTGINIEQALSGIPAVTAVKRINANHLNIAESVAHLACWNKVMAKRLDSENYQPTKEEDFPVIDHLEEHQWTELKNRLRASFEALVQKLESKEETGLHNPMFEGATSAYRNLHGQVSHLHYHMGQIMLLKKAFN